MQTRKLILFESYVAGTLWQNSGLDIPVVTGNDMDNPRKESVLEFSTNNFGNTMIAENVVAAGGTFRMATQETINLIHDAGYCTAQRIINSIMIRSASMKKISKRVKMA